ncbi:alpha/beta hydrolase [Streptomyces sp. NPDC003032]
MTEERRAPRPAGATMLDLHTVAELRAMHDRQMAKLPRPEVHEAVDLTVAGRPARLYRPDGALPQPALVFFHGSGWALGGVESYDPVVRALTRACRVAFVSVGYRRPPEHPHPAAVDDAEAAVRWVAAHAMELGLDAARLGIAAESGGGQIALAAALRLTTRPAVGHRDPAAPALALQLLAYPIVDLRPDPPTGAHSADLRGMLDLYLGDADRTDPEVSPLLAPDLSGLPPTVIGTGEFDFLRPQIREFAARLSAAGVATTLLDGAGLDHGYLGWGSLARGPAEAIDALGACVRRALRPTLRPADPPGPAAR